MRLAIAGIVLVALAGCSSVDEGWTEVPLPDDVTASHLLVADGRLVVGGSIGEHPALLVADDDGVPQPVDVAASSFYGEVARWTSIVADGEALYALGGRTGGGHGSPRWSTWSGDLDGLAEGAEQGREVFGGWRGGGLVGMAVLDGVPVIVGGRTGDGPGLDIALWLPDGDAWVEQPSAGTPLAATADELPFAADVTTVGDRLLIAGFVQRLAGGRVTTTPAVWLGRPLGSWERIDLPVEAAVAAADAASCDLAGRCVVTGHADDLLVAWEIEAGQVERIELPELPVATALPAVLTASGPVVVEPLLDGAGRGDPVAATALDGALYVLAGIDGRVRLWVKEL